MNVVENAAKQKKISLLYTAGQTLETLSFTQREFEAGRMSGPEKMRLDNLAMIANALAHLNGFSTFADETPGEWDKYK